MNWRQSLFGVVILMVFEGALRKWVLPGFQAQIYLAKDALVVLAYLGFLSARPPPGSHQLLMGPLKFFFALNLAYSVLQIANLNSPSIAVSLVGLKNYTLYFLLALMVPHAFESIDDVERKFRIFMILMIPVAVLGLAQFAAPPDSIINTYVQRDDDAQMFISQIGATGRVRATGTFSYLSGFSTFVSAMFNFALAYMLAGRRDVRKNMIPYLLLLSCAAAMFTTGSRSVVWGELVLAPIILALCTRAGLITGGVFVRALVLTGVAALVLGLVADDAVDAFNTRAANADDPLVRLLSPLTELMAAFEASPVFGMGIGATHGSAMSIMGTQDRWWLLGNLFEVETARVMQEVGLLGFLLVYSMRVYLMLFAARMVLQLRTPLFKALSAVFAAFFFQHLGLFVINSPTDGVLYWFVAGLLFAMYRLDYDREAARQPVGPKRMRGRHLVRPMGA